ncbi:helix-turn-helix transcriptional regulator [Haliscomenobacter hydrossis]|uniref:Transcriptional regulator, AraC family n=1 Tax=Haliscomenobacter hydrossis (strain ATCC 27775 / DSM 1100 / LMG 10767 / O) TaxID=760192 RepID=F4L565_HALH1|nr:helix-turn-helix transcriptional regulator [Haliscomenobacter hydrossis]AEE48786.1 transcriptional regulator, AraC family [Haliscomenobacter hydrossis DSM 1100]
MNYQTYPPSPDLAPLIKCFWSLEFSDNTTLEKQTIVPDGCMELIVHFGDLYQQFQVDGSSSVQPRSFVFGQLSSSLEIAPTGHTGIIAARFHPDGFTPMTPTALAEMENKAVALDELFGEAGIQLEQNILAATSNPERIRLLETFILSRLSTPEAIDRVVKSSVDLLMILEGQVKVEHIAGQLNVNRRQLERKFSTTVGLSPKQLSKIIRIQAALKKLNQDPEANLTDLAYQNGYFDQSHFIKDFKEFTGISPKQFFAGHLKLSALFIGME